MTPPTDQSTASPAVTTDGPVEDPKQTWPRKSIAPAGHVATLMLHFFDGILHQLFQSTTPGEDAAHTWVPIGGQGEDSVPASDGKSRVWTPVRPGDLGTPVGTSDPDAYKAQYQQQPQIPLDRSYRMILANNRLTDRDVDIRDYGRSIVNRDTNQVIAKRIYSTDGDVWAPVEAQEKPGATTATDPNQPVPPAGQAQQPGAVVSDRPPQAHE